MRVYYDDQPDALYGSWEMSPEGVVEIGEGVNVDTTSQGKIAGTEILYASKRIGLNMTLSYTLPRQGFDRSKDYLTTRHSRHMVRRVDRERQENEQEETGESKQEGQGMVCISHATWTVLSLGGKENQGE